MKLPLVVLGLLVAAAAGYMAWDRLHVLPGLRSTITASLADPEAAQFRNEKRQNGYLCGEINRRNRLGGYVGFSRFIAHKNHGYAVDRESMVTWANHSGPTVGQLINEAQLSGGDPALMETIAAARHGTEFERLWGQNCR